MVADTVATLADLCQTKDKAELVNGEIIFMPPTSDEPAHAAEESFASLRDYARRTRQGRAMGDNRGFRAHLPHRESFSPDAAFYVGPSGGMKFLDRAPVFAVEVRSENDYGRPAERGIAAKIADYFAAGTLVVWDVDLLSRDVVRKYRADAPDQSEIFRRGEVADAEPAVPGWRMPVDDLFLQETIDE